MKEFLDPGFLVLLVACVMLVATVRHIVTFLLDSPRRRNLMGHFIYLMIRFWRSPTPLSHYTARQLRDELERREAGKKS